MFCALIMSFEMPKGVVIGLIQSCTSAKPQPLACFHPDPHTLTVIESSQCVIELTEAAIVRLVVLSTYADQMCLSLASVHRVNMSLVKRDLLLNPNKEAAQQALDTEASLTDRVLYKPCRCTVSRGELPVAAPLCADVVAGLGLQPSVG